MKPLCSDSRTIVRFALVLVLLSLVVGAGAVAAEPSLVEVSNLRVGLDPQVDTHQLVLPAGAEQLYVRFDYAETAQQEMTVALTARGNISLYSVADRYDGSGTATVPVTGVDVYQRLTDMLGFTLEDAQTSAQQAAAATRETVIQEYLLAVQASLNQLRFTLEPLGRLPLADAPAAERTTVAEALDELDALLRRALDAGSADEKREQAERMAPHIARAREAAAALGADAEAVATMPLPESGSDVRTAYTAQVLVNGDTAISAEFEIRRPTEVYLPLLLRDVPLAAGAEPTR